MPLSRKLAARYTPDVPQKKPQHGAGVVSLFAVTHQGPAQGGKAGGGEPPNSNLANSRVLFKH